MRPGVLELYTFTRVRTRVLKHVLYTSTIGTTGIAKRVPWYVHVYLARYVQYPTTHVLFLSEAVTYHAIVHVRTYHGTRVLLSNNVMSQRTYVHVYHGTIILSSYV